VFRESRRHRCAVAPTLDWLRSSSDSGRHQHSQGLRAWPTMHSFTLDAVLKICNLLLAVHVVLAPRNRSRSMPVRKHI
jgi:hypothetical protein